MNVQIPISWSEHRFRPRIGTKRNCRLLKKKLTILSALAALAVNAFGAEIKTGPYRVQWGKQQSQIVQVRMNCDAPKCTGEMLPTYEVVCAYSGPYPHRCNVCGKRATYPVLYPELRPLQSKAASAGEKGAAFVVKDSPPRNGIRK